MADSILGLLSSKKFADEGDRFYNHRRQILHSYPTGKAPLTGILSHIPEEATNDSIFIWYEDRYKSPRPALRGTNPVTSDAPSTGDANDGTGMTAGAKAVTVSFYIKVDSTKELKLGQILRLESTGDLFWIDLIVRGVSSESLLGYVRAKLVRAETVATGDWVAGQYAQVIGTAFGEGASGTGKSDSAFLRPYAIQNTTQIFEDSFKFPGSVLKMGLKYDRSGPYREKAHKTVTEHMTNLERSIIFGKRATVSRASFDSSQEDLTVRHMSGIIEFLELWDAGSTGLTIDGATYAPYSFKAISSSDSDEQKRIITNTAGTISNSQFLQYAERISRYRTNRSDEKLVLLGNGALIAITQMFRRSTNYTVKQTEKIYGLTVTTVSTPFGDFHLVTHPLFTEHPTMTNWMLFLDIWNLKYRPLTDRDTTLLKNQQNRGDDFRKDTYRTEAGLEMWMPESMMLIKNVVSFIED